MKNIIIIPLLLALLLFVPFIYAEDSLDIPIGDSIFLKASFDNCTKINQERINPGSFTTIHNLTFHWENAYKITYKNNEDKTDYVIVWQCNVTDEYYVLSDLHVLHEYYSDYTKDNNSVIYVESPNADYVYGILVDTQNISYSEDDLVHGILGLPSLYELTNSGYHYDPPIDVIDASPHDYNPHGSSKSGAWDMAINNPDWYYEHYDYGYNGEIDEYLYDQYYW